MGPRGDAEQQLAILNDRISKVEVALLEAYANREQANLAICKQRLDELNDEMDLLVPPQRPPVD